VGGSGGKPCAALRRSQTGGYLVDRNRDRSNRAGRVVTHDNPENRDRRIAPDAVLEDEPLLIRLPDAVVATLLLKICGGSGAAAGADPVSSRTARSAAACRARGL